MCTFSIDPITRNPVEPDRTTHTIWLNLTCTHPGTVETHAPLPRVPLPQSSVSHRAPMHPAPVLPIGVTTVAIHLACSLRIEHPAPVKRRSRHGSLTPRHASSTFVAIPPPIPHRSRPSQPPTIPPLIPVAGRATSGSGSLAARA
jgi:hypothetical protein